MQFFTKVFLFLCLVSTTCWAQKKATFGIATYYSDKFQGKRTANGEHYNKNELTAAHPSLPFNTRIKVTNINTKKSVVVRINDRGPHIKGRALDMSRAAAAKIGLISKGKAKVKIEVLNKKQWKA
jgi:rare lipoprotein A